MPQFPYPTASKATKEKIKALILLFEQEQTPVASILEELHQYTTIPIDEASLRTYWNGQNLDDFVELIAMPALEHWASIEDEEAKLLLAELLENLSSQAIIHRNGTALEKRYRKSSGTISDWIFYEDILRVEELLALLKIDTTLPL